MKVVYVSPEAMPFAKTGGLADVAGALPCALAGLGVEISVFLPLYTEIRKRGFHPGPTGVRPSLRVGDRVVNGAVARTELPDCKVSWYFVDCLELYARDELYGDYHDNSERFIFFCRAVLDSLPKLGIRPDVIHVNDWQTALIPVYARAIHPTPAKTVITVHNISYQGIFPERHFPFTGLDWSLFNWKKLEFYGKVNFLKGGIVFADAVTTVSERYAEEIQTPEFGCGLEGVLRERRASVAGILNGADYASWSPPTDLQLPANYSAEDMSGKRACREELRKEFGLPATDGPLLGTVGRLVPQKGFDILSEAWPEIAREGAQLVVLGTGLPELEEAASGLAASDPEHVGVRVGFDERLAHLITAGSDIFLMPSRFEPCGLNQMYALRYGTVPVVRRTGGLADTITDYGPSAPEKGKANGFVFDDAEPQALLGAVKRAIALWRDRPAWAKLVARAMSQDWGWERSASKYLDLYESLL